MSKVRRHSGKRLNSVSKPDYGMFCESELRAWADSIALDSFFFCDIPSLIQHLKVEHGMSFDQIQATVTYIDRIVDEPGTSPFGGWEKYY